MSTALYNRYRPATFSQVVGQEHVTTALMQALRTGRLHHAYLFSGPRGCGKTSSARILAASLNCERGPTPEPCGVCDQCVSIRTGSSMDVTEIDAASHGLVDDARDLRERAFFAPASARFKVFVVDEAHMVTAAAFNALLKVVEEPPPYLKFIFATTEPDKVIATIRSRTHHYAFRLVPPGVLRDHLASVCAQEGAEVDPSVLPLVVRAGAGSVRDSLSVLDQLLAGAGPEGLRYDRAVALLGMTDGVLLDETVDALAVRDGATLFTVVDKVVGSGHDPRRFTADLLERLRDLILINAVPDAVERGLLDAFSSDQIDRMKAQAGRVGPAELSRTADVLHAGLAEMRGTASPRLLLELVLARVLLPGAATDPAALLVRLERLERGQAAGAPALVTPASASAAEPTAPVGSPAPPAPYTPSTRPPASAPALAHAAEPRPAPSTGPADGAPAPRPGGGWGGPASGPTAPAGRQSPPPPAAQPAQRPAAADGGGGPEAATVRARWDQVLAATRRRRVVTASLLVEHVSVLEVRSNEVFLALSTPPMAKVFSQGNHADVLAEALAETFGGAWRVTIGEPGASGGRPGAGGARGGPGRPAGAPTGHAPTADGPGRPTPPGPTPPGPPPSPAAAAWSGPQPGQGVRPPTGYAAQPQPSAGYGAGLAGGGVQPPLQAGVAGRAGGFAGSAIATAERGPLGPGLDAAPAPTFARQDAGLGLTAAPAPVAVTTVGGSAAAGGAVATPSHTTTAVPRAFGAGDDATDEPSPDDEDAPTHPGATLTGEAAAVELLRVGLGATVIEQRGDG
ncbi:DNA polymerase III subunit gamma and tau [Pseudofrankia sp. BMG5.36]|uniref:DNA polymerase III subunit gamma and tau n=1 Tax=Pseudofrankia sp. BMG5.36 TaxID=1834512 RepID=UPI0008D8E80E|nr:DNA polymerase III subunit gamma and tau [Pseudofrankia sp. BMG5.36]OHV44910.1 DNA polymerase III subunit gamma/tau [Pseudofrankia sp. BMG5.36]